MNRDPQSLDEIEWCLWFNLMCQCERCGAEADLLAFEVRLDDSPMEWAKQITPIVKSLGWSAPNEFGLLCPRCAKLA